MAGDVSSSPVEETFVIEGFGGTAVAHQVGTNLMVDSILHNITFLMVCTHFCYLKNFYFHKL